MGVRDQGVDSGRWMVIPRTLCFVTNGADVLLMQRAAHKRAFPGYYNGVGGHMERDEDPQSGALREIREETGLTVQAVRFRGAVQIDAGTGILLFVFVAESESRTLIECDEGTLHWVPRDSARDLPLVEDVPLLWPRLFNDDPPFFAHVHYDAADKMVFRFFGEG